jgi:glycosyltransferase involved in cell wall biosynthesis
MLDYINDKNAIVLDKLKEAEVYDPNFFPEIGSRGTWMTPNEDDLIEKLRWVRNNYEAAKVIGDNAEKWVRDNYNWKLAAQAFKQNLL